jgi:hypothetical protein
MLKLIELAIKNFPHVFKVLMSLNPLEWELTKALQYTTLGWQNEPYVAPWNSSLFVPMEVKK